MNLNASTEFDNKENKQKFQYFLILLNKMLSFSKNTNLVYASVYFVS